MMTDLKLQSGEGILLQTKGAGLYDGHNEISVDELYLTNKNIIYVYEKSIGVFKSETVVDRIPLSSIAVINGLVQAEIVDDEDYGKTIQLIYTTGKRELLEIDESPNKLYPVWESGIINAVNNILACMDEENLEQKQQSPEITNCAKTVYCNQCGTKVDVSSKFCNQCGAPIYDVSMVASSAKQTNASANDFHEEQHNKRNTVYKGTLHKCPNCGEVLESFISTCPTCGYELRDVNASDSIVKFYNDLKSTSDNEQKKHLIRTFPIPNAKEDIIEFMILASSNLFNEDNIDIYNAWISKFDQCYQKAMLLFKNDSDFVRIQKIYNDCQKKILAGKDRKTKKITTEAIIRNIAVCVGVIMLLIAILVDKFNGNSVLYEIISYVLFIVSAATLVKRGAVLLDYAVAAGGGFLLILGSFLLDNGSMAQLCGGIVLVIMAVNYFKSMKSNKQE